MSVLTKLFVVLLVVCSMLQSAAIVVFVNRADEYHQAITKFQTDKVSLTRENENVKMHMGELQSAMAQAAQGASARESALNSKLTTAQGDAAKLEGAVADAKKETELANATNKGISDALKAAQDENKGYQALNTDLRNKNDDLNKQNGELNTTVTVLDNKNRALEQQYRILQEQMAEATNAMKNGGAGANGGGSSQPAPAASGPINAVVRSVDIIGGKKYATISVGSSDNVQKGMKFNVVNRNTGEFLGMLTVERVEPNEAIGQVEGVKIDKIQPGVDARTQL